MKDDVDKMKHKIKLFLIPFMLLATLFFVTACSQDPTAYDNNDANGYTVSVKYDANGGVFTGTSSIMVDSFNIADMKKDASGMVNVKLMKPDDPKRGDWQPANGNLILEGWYKERTESINADGEKVYTYSGKFNFDTDVVTIDPSKTHTSAEPVVTLYARWIQKFEVRFFSVHTGEPIGKTYEFNPLEEVEITIPHWNTETGRMEMYKFPTVTGKTFEAVYSDMAGTNRIDGSVLDHPGKIDKVTGEVTNPVLDVYVEYKEGNWFNIYNAEQLSSIKDFTGHYILHEDLDFDGVEWPTSFTRRFSGEIIGNGHTIKNVTIAQKDISSTEFGLFGILMAGAKISNVTFENITTSIEAGTRTPGSAYGLLIGNLQKDTVLENVQIVSSKLQISAQCFWGTSDYGIGLICGIGSTDIDHSGITCEVTGEGNVTVTVDEKGTVTIVSG